MSVFYGFDELPIFKHAVVTIGSFDGVHAGHRAIIEQINELVAEKGGESVVITFSPHPRGVLGKEKIHQLNTIAEKCRRLGAAGIDNVIIAPFTHAFSKLSSHDFVKDYLVGKIDVDTLVVGYNHHFGRDKEGDFSYLDSMKERFGFDVCMIPKQEIARSKVSSTVIRSLIMRGDMDAAAESLGYHYCVEGVVGTHGELGSVDESKLIPGEGKYLVTVDENDRSFAGEVIVARGKIGLKGSYENLEGRNVLIIFDQRALKTSEK